MISRNPLFIRASFGQMDKKEADKLILQVVVIPYSSGQVSDVKEMMVWDAAKR